MGGLGNVQVVGQDFDEQVGSSAMLPESAALGGASAAKGGMLVTVIAFAAVDLVPWGDRALADDDDGCQPGEECVVVVGERVDCPTHWTCSDGEPSFLSADCWREITAMQDARVSGEFREPRANGPHKGTDFAVPDGTAVYALKDGVVREARGDLPSGDSSTTMGNYVIIDYDDGTVGRYLHLQAVSVETGWGVGAGEQIAESNSTGRGITGPHLHYDFEFEDEEGWTYGDVKLEHMSCG